ncbi:hypothetical protein K458DRAFT_303033 [Lentithecium fluviatile CBS 122367]|uniref:Uncharacterized protein n=1 Tax=Lentithecium fluviatile CBS 122367 TaxID=1168545 RepID=A0A6G1J1W8_9PLEO|nr:hypothetical protein K458DRAFT_303033 [Lentithecium fluviatile CBS 122367]
MRAAARLFASVKPGQFLEAGAPTGLTGLRAHPSPRSTLLYHYNATLDKLKEIPESSVYRQSTEALTRHRLKVVEEMVPAGWASWAERIEGQIADDPGAYTAAQTSAGTNVFAPRDQDIDPRLARAEWDGEKKVFLPEGIRSEKERSKHVKMIKGDKNYDPSRTFARSKFEPEPQYTIDAISELENRIGGGLIEEVIEVAKGEHKLVYEMVKARVWEPLEEQAPEGQWSYHERLSHTSTQKP